MRYVLRPRQALPERAGPSSGHGVSAITCALVAVVASIVAAKCVAVRVDEEAPLGVEFLTAGEEGVAANQRAES